MTKLVTEHVEWEDTRRIGDAFSIIESKSKPVELVEMHPDLFYRAKDEENKGTMELSYLIHFDEKKLWNTPISLNQCMDKNVIVVYGGGEKIPLIIRG
jgi:hypothetical protein